MNGNFKGFLLLELLISLTILLIMLLGLCQILLAIPRLNYHHFFLLYQQQQFATYWTLLNLDLKKAGYGISNFSPLASFKAIKIIKDDEKNVISFFWNKDQVNSKLVKKINSLNEAIYIDKVNNLKQKDFALLAENNPITGKSHWSLILIKDILEIPTTKILKITFKHIYSGPDNYFLPFHELAYFIKVEKISYSFNKKEKRIDKIINDEWIEPVADFIENNEFSFCIEEDSINQKCLEVAIVSLANEIKISQYHYFNLLNINN